MLKLKPDTIYTIHTHIFNYIYLVCWFFLAQISYSSSLPHQTYTNLKSECNDLYLLNILNKFLNLHHGMFSAKFIFNMQNFWLFYTPQPLSYLISKISEIMDHNVIAINLYIYLYLPYTPTNYLIIITYSPFNQSNLIK